MPSITFVEHAGERHTIVAEPGKSLMLNALEQGVPGIDGDCGGGAACGTCHCFVEGDWVGSFPEPDAMENVMLSMRPDQNDRSRLSCQIDIEPSHDGLVVHLPEHQM